MQWHSPAAKHCTVDAVLRDQRKTLKVLYQLIAYSMGGVVLFLIAPGAVTAEETIVVQDDAAEHVQIYKTREERREAGLKHELTDWLTIAGLFELEYLEQRFGLHDTPSRTHDDNFSRALQLGVEVTPWSWIKGELIYEYDSDDSTSTHTLNEVIVAFEAGDFELELGRLFVPFGVYFSHFVSGPLLEFGETRVDGMSLNYGPDDRFDLSAFVFKSDVDRVGSGNGSLDWGLSTAISPFEFGSFGVSYLADLAESQEGLLSDNNNKYESRVPGLSAYAILGYDRFEITAEFVQALSSFKELDLDRNKPSAWNIELAFYPVSNIEWALRLEGSDELEDTPRLQGGTAVAWQVTRNANIRLEYLWGTFKRGLAEDSKERELDKVYQFGGQISIEF